MTQSRPAGSGHVQKPVGHTLSWRGWVVECTGEISIPLLVTSFKIFYFIFFSGEINLSDEM